MLKPSLKVLILEYEKIIIESAIQNHRWKINLCVQPLNGLSVLKDETEDSNPPQMWFQSQILYLTLLYLLYHAFCSMNNLWIHFAFGQILNFYRLNVPKPTCNVSSAIFIPLISNLLKDVLKMHSSSRSSNSTFMFCKIAWYLSLSKLFL